MTKSTYIYIGIGILAAIAGGILIFRGTTIEVVKSTGALIGLKSGSGDTGPISGIACVNYNIRPLAVMISSDPEARPLSGIGDADIVFEMPVTPSGVTRMMPVFQCSVPDEIGSVRSARSDFVPLALGLNVIYAHFGGEHNVLDELNAGVINNINGLIYDGTIYYRKKNIPRPHNAFTSASLLNKVIGELRYAKTGIVNGYQHEKESKSLGQEQPPVFYKAQFQVAWKYDTLSNSYLRSRGNRPETDKNNGKQVSVQNVVEMNTTWSPISKDYLRIKTVGSGPATYYKNGQKIAGTWEKKGDKDKLFFYDQEHKEVKFTPGKIWVEITTNL